MATLSRSTLESSNARVKELTVVPMPHPGHQMCGMRSMRRNCSTGFPGITRVVSATRHLQDDLQYVFGLVHAAPGMPDQLHDGVACGGAFYFAHHLAEVQLRHNQRLNLACDFGDLFLREGPCGDQPELADL